MPDHPPEPWRNEYERKLLRRARRAYPEFYRRAARNEAETMDWLVLNHHCLIGCYSESPPENPAERRKWEYGTSAVEEGFVEFREWIRACPTFTGLPRPAQRRIEKALFEIEWIDPEEESDE